jgi:RimJ/RimL family protein N-acetyltransferase
MLLETPRLVLRRFRSDDVPAFSAYRSDPEIARYQSWSAPYSLETAAERIRTYTTDEAEPGWFQYAVELKADGCLIGDVGVNLHENLRQADLGCSMAPGRQGYGYAIEAVRAVLQDRFASGLRRMSAQCDARNLRSAHLLERAGFRLEGERPAFTWLKGEWIDERLYGLLAEQWIPLTAGA